MTLMRLGGPDRRQLVTTAAQRWAEELTEVSLGTNLLHHLDLIDDAFDVTTGEPDAMNRLLSGGTVRLSALVPVLPADDVVDVANERMRMIARTAAANFEERGVHTAHLAVGLARWVDPAGGPTPNAPILLFPLSIVAAGTGGADHELVIDGDWCVNPVLLMKLRTDGGVVIPDLLPGVDREEPGIDVGDVQDMLAAFADLVHGAPNQLPGFSIDPRGIIGNFDTTVQSVVDDIEGSTTQLVDHALIGALAGDVGARAELQARHRDISVAAPDAIAPAAEFIVLDADSSQHHAINTVLSGADLVVHGPPGSGSSQTIANLITSLVAQRRSVLFVSEKRAAIDAVTRRLLDVDLGGLVMDLHDGVGSQPRVAADLARSLADAGTTPSPDRSPVDEQVADRQLVDQRRRLAAHCSAMNATREPWGVSVFDLQAELLGAGAGAGAGLTSGLEASSLRALTLQGVQQLSARLQEWVNLGGPAIADPAANPWAAALGRVQSTEQASGLVAFADHIIDELLPSAANQLRATCDAAGLREPDALGGWTAMFDLLDEVGRVAPAMHPHGLEIDLSGYVTALAPAARSGMGRRLSRLVDGDFRTAGTDALGWVTDPTMPLSEVRQLFIRCGELRDRWAAMRIDAGAPRVPVEAAAARASLDQLRAALASLGVWIDRDDLATLPFHEIDRAVRPLSEGRNGLFRAPRLLELRTGLLDAGLGPLLDGITQRRSNADEAASAFQTGWIEAVLGWIRDNDPAIASIDGSELSRLERDFRVTDRGWISAGRDRVRRAWAEWVVAARASFPDQERAVLSAATGRQGHLPLCRLFAAAPEVISALKPCWAMSPLVVSQLLPSMSGLFDVVIFDGASRVATAVAIPALLRAERAVVVGDPRQLPPMTGVSILDQLAAVLPAPTGSRTLSWHHRCGDERLIAFSNAQPGLYAGSITSVPVANPGAVEDCLRFVAVGGDDVGRVVELIAEHARSHPEESLGVIALDAGHAARIGDELRAACAVDPVLARFASSRNGEPLFVKDLDRVQGDQRDAIIFTIGEARGSDVRIGQPGEPFDRAGGEHRLNVAITRAKRRMTVVSGLLAADLDPARLTSEGARMLRRYLVYVESGGTDLGVGPADPLTLSPFEVDLLDRIRAVGIPVTAHHGGSAGRVDLALGHPSRAGEMVLAVEADGSSYASLPTTRDRDRLRQDQLERLGWSFLRVWSTSWCSQRDRELERIVRAWRDAVAAADRRHADPHADPQAGPTVRLPPEPTVVLPSDRRPATDDGVGATRPSVPGTF